jgi:hypothetical protein
MKQASGEEQPCPVCGMLVFVANVAGKKMVFNSAKMRRQHGCPTDPRQVMIAQLAKLAEEGPLVVTGPVRVEPENHRLQREYNACVAEQRRLIQADTLPDRRKLLRECEAKRKQLLKAISHLGGFVHRDGSGTGASSIQEVGQTRLGRRTRGRR